MHATQTCLCGVSTLAPQLKGERERSQSLNVIRFAKQPIRVRDNRDQLSRARFLPGRCAWRSLRALAFRRRTERRNARACLNSGGWGRRGGNIQFFASPLKEISVGGAEGVCCLSERLIGFLTTVTSLRRQCWSTCVQGRCHPTGRCAY